MGTATKENIDQAVDLVLAETSRDKAIEALVEDGMNRGSAQILYRSVKAMYDGAQHFTSTVSTLTVETMLEKLLETEPEKLLGAIECVRGHIIYQHRHGSTAYGKKMMDLVYEFEELYG